MRALGVVLSLVLMFWANQTRSQGEVASPVARAGTTWQLVWASSGGEVAYSIVVDRPTPEGYEAHMSYQGRDFPMKFDRAMNRLVSPLITPREIQELGAWIYSRPCETMRFPMKDGDSWSSSFEGVTAVRDSADQPRRRVTGECSAQARALPLQAFLGTDYPALEIIVRKKAIHSGAFTGSEEATERYVWLPAVGHWLSADIETKVFNEQGRQVRGGKSSIRLVGYIGQ